MGTAADLSPRELRFTTHGAQHFLATLDHAEVADVLHALRGQPAQRAGVRLFGVEALDSLLGADGPLGRIAARLMTGAPRAVRALLFDKSPGANWALGWHQDRVIAVRQRRYTPGFSAWTRKAGAIHVEPPPELMARMVTLRLHLDAVPDTNAPLLVAPGSHRLGRIAERDVPAAVRACGKVACTAGVGDVWAYATPILHASERSLAPRRRRVLQVDYACEDLPGGLEWLGV